jgi:hypothetical protein
MKKGLLKDLYPELEKEWDFEKNTVSFDTITCGSGYRAFWKCDTCGNKWDVAVCSRVSKRSGTLTRCFKCRRKRVKPEDRVGVRSPELIKEWHPKNDISIDLVSHASNKNRWWICGKGHEWEANPNDRVNKGNGCPACSGRVATPETSLAFRFPELLKEWDYERNKKDPSNVTYGSGLKAWWICSNGHSYPATVCDRTGRRKNGCPDCKYYKSSKMELFVYCEVKYYYPDALHRHKLDKVECDIFIPSLNIGIEIDGGLWHKGREIMDENKLIHFTKLGVTLISVREFRLGIFNPYTVVYPKSYSLFSSISKPLMSLLAKVSNDDRLVEYQHRKQPINIGEYNNMIKDYPLNGFGETAQKVRDKLNKI